ncbi:23S rRNA (pseudouridine(1915)-N(3))-methyltransferase RlmH [Paraliomyxa miuraensis]|uniref:23S rRNA (pseudouridine(1915)-N(3))-methyltransferase RlmH n=1 Tax=Paraliomyxa miuraensis TaxID=376150 RepID=UPI002253D34B|nr:23S rRNA (pseudouridine(1915)-N(3))-methyltransferase RlmH [Paraliomyxa miuraensis]MCX4243218.1 23S rRNA (pseudouridine(1915)-N(3))-methyltransferase RlmH [Paraliomyxa miuraensis]
MQLRVLAIGKLRDSRLEGVCDEYVKRSRSLLPIERVACRSAADQERLAGQDGAPVIVLDERGEQLDTAALAALLGSMRSAGRRRVDFLIGDAHGYDDAARARADRVLALSRLTLPHRLAQLLLCEQLYRVGTVLAGHPYHHA